MWQREGQDMCANFTVVAARGKFYCGSIFGRPEESDLATGLVLRRLDAQAGSGGMLWPAHRGRELVSFSGNEPVIAAGDSMAPTSPPPRHGG